MCVCVLCVYTHNTKDHHCNFRNFQNLDSNIYSFNISTGSALPVTVKHEIYLFPPVAGDKLKS